MNLIEAMARAASGLSYDAWQSSRSAHFEHDGPTIYSEHMDSMRAAFTAAEAAGWKMVPVVATEEMVAAGTEWHGEVGTKPHLGEIAAIWSAMLSASPAVE